MSSRCVLSSDKCSGDLRPRNSFDDNVAEIIRRRAGLLRVDSVCGFHFCQIVDLYPLSEKKCCNPVGKHSKPAVFQLRMITMEMVHKYRVVLPASLVPGKKLCTNCVKALNARLLQYGDANENRQQTEAPTTSRAQVQEGKGEADNLVGDGKPREINTNDADYDEIFPTPPDTALSDLNKCLTFLSLDPCDTQKLKYVKRYPGDLLASIKSKIITKMEKSSGLNFDDLRRSEEQSFHEMLEQLRTAYHLTSEETMKMQILSVLPASWSLKQVADFFNVSVSVVRRVRSLVSEQGILPTPLGRRRMGLCEEVKKKVISFYEENSRQLPGIKDHVTVKVGDTKVQRQKMLVLMTLKELYANFKSDYADLQISFSKFAELRPRECVLAGASGTHSVCVCIYHENFSLLIEGAHLEKHEDGKHKFMSTSDVLNLAICPEPKSACYLGECKKCPGFTSIQEKLEVNFDERMQTEVEYKKWVSTDRAALLTCISTTDEFVEHVEDVLPSFLCHHFVAKEQAMFLKNAKAGLKRGSCIAIGDFSENYSVCHQAAIQDTHWDNTQITLHPFVCYYVNSEGEQQIFNFVVVSDYMKHETLAVSAFQHRLIAKLKENIQDLEEVHYMTDGSSAQYKNKFNALNLRMHFEDFQVKGRWHFFASCHGKGPCDGLAGRMKRLAMLESLRRVREESILTARQFYEWAKRVFMDSTWVELVTKEEIEEFRVQYGLRYRKDVPALEGISSAHCLIPLSTNVIQVKQYSSADTCLYVYHGDLTAPKFDDLHGFIMVSQDCAWYLGYVTERYQTENKVEVRWLEQDGPLHFKFPEVDERKVISISDVISVVNVEAVTEVTFKLTKRCAKYGNDEQLKR
ncbi:hypothetical protein ONE63_006710 [Megalurothrips usitatus]|uniref:Uncharacterized protein n=1 Tax=Megalurothrips usitatus TaxID=439358 RepID=A0AAV7XY67_9NEOP|nr:hypothetical protein ONE63_006710 [Megalurothrips usitatus]